MASFEVDEQQRPAADDSVRLNQVIDETASNYASFIVTEPEKDVSLTLNCLKLVCIRFSSSFLLSSTKVNPTTVLIPGGGGGGGVAPL